MRNLTLKHAIVIIMKKKELIDIPELFTYIQVFIESENVLNCKGRSSKVYACNTIEFIAKDYKFKSE